MQNQQNMQPGYLHTLLTVFVSFLALVGMLQCGCNQTSESSGKLELKIAASKTLVKAPEKEFEVVITTAEGRPLPSLTDLKLQAHFLQQETLEQGARTSQANYLAHKHEADKQHFTTSFIIPLTQYATNTESEEQENQESELRIPILLQPNNQATKLRVGVELLDKQNNVLQSIEVSWIKNELLITEPTAIQAQEGLFSLTLKNTQDIPLKTHQLILNLASDQGDTCLFSQTNTAQARLDELWSRHPSLDPGAQTSPLSFKLSKADGIETLANLTISIRQEDGSVLASKTVACQAASVKSAQFLPSKDHKEGNQQQLDYPTTLPTIHMKLMPITNKKFKLYLENKGQKISKKLLQLVKLNYNVQGPGDTTNIKFKRGSLADINGASLAALIGSSLQEGQTKKLEIILEPGNADSLTLHFSLKGTENSNSATLLNWTKKEKPSKKKEESGKVKEETQQPIGNLQENVQEEPEKQEKLKAPINIKNEEPIQQSTSSLKERLEQAPINQQEEVKEASNNLQAEPEQSSTRQEEVKETTNTPPEIPTHAPSKEQKQLEKVISNSQQEPEQFPSKQEEGFQLNKSNLQDRPEKAAPKQKKQVKEVASKVQEKLKPASALAAAIKKKKQVTANPGSMEEESVKATPKEQPADKLKERVKKEISSPLPDLSISIKTDARFPKKFKIVLVNKGENISEDAIKKVRLWYDVSGIGDMLAIDLKKSLNSKVINGESLLDFINSGLKKGQTAEFELSVETSNAQALTIGLLLEGIQNSNPVTFNWAKNYLGPITPNYRSFA